MGVSTKNWPTTRFCPAGTLTAPTAVGFTNSPALAGENCELTMPIANVSAMVMATDRDHFIGKTPSSNDEIVEADCGALLDRFHQ
jgi:hypothetical protein